MSFLHWTNVDNTMNAISVDAETNDKLKKVKLENGFYNIINGERVSAGKTLSVVNPEKKPMKVQHFLQASSLIIGKRHHRSNVN